jgi:uncharacterized protein YkwD
MPAYTCPHCQKRFTAPASTSAAQVACPHCRQAVALPNTSAARWFHAQAKKKCGPYTWQQLLTLAQRGDLHCDDMLLQEGTKQWVRAGTLPALFMNAGSSSQSTAVAKSPPPVARKSLRLSFGWVIAALTGAGACAMLGLAIGIYFFFLHAKPADPQHANTDQVGVEKKKEPAKINGDPPKKVGDLSKKEVKTEDKKKTPQEKEPPAQPYAKWADQFVERLNRQRKRAGLDRVTLDAELSRGCLAHAKYLAKHVDPRKVDAAQLSEEDPKKSGFSIEGQWAGQNAMVAFAEPLVALEKWMGRLFSRALLLTPEMQSVGIGFEPTGQGNWICVLDPVRGRGEPIVVFPAPKQTDVPLSFSGGPEVPDPKAAAGFPVTVTLPPARKVTDVRIELRDEKDKLVEGWTWTPEKPVPSGRQHNTIALVPKGLLHRGAVYQVKASAQVDGKLWNLAWSFTTEDDSDSKGIWAKKALARVNAYRAHAGLKPVELDGLLSRGCLAHARYLIINEGHPALQGLNAHDENLDLAGASEEGRSAGKASNIAVGDFEPIDGVDAWMATLYHRVPILEPNLKTIGFGCARGRRQGWVAVMNVSSGRGEEPRPGPLFYPAPDQTGVPLSFPNGGEEPNPIPDDKTGRAGFPITASFPHDKPLKNAIGKLTSSQGIETPCWFSAPEKPANPKEEARQGNTVCLIPKEPLAANATYHVRLQGQLGDKAWDKKWKFTTGEGGLSVPTATRLVVDRLNQYRAKAGLSAIVLDEKLSYGCQLHAEYLARNAEVLLKKNASVNDEDVNLPGFTREGLRSAQQSMVFTNAPTPVFQVDDLMATFSSRVYLLDPRLQRIGFGCFHDVGRGWRCVLDVNRGRGDSRVVVYPAPKQEDVPATGFDLIKDAQGSPGFPISVTFPPQMKLGKAQAALKDADDKDVDFLLSTPEKPLNAKFQRGIIGIHPLAPLQAGRVYSVTVSVIVNGTEWRKNWQFTTAKKK